MENVGQKLKFTHKLTTNCNFQMASLFFIYLNCHRMESTGLWDIKGNKVNIYAAFKNQSELSQETGSEASIGLVCALLPSTM